MALEICSLSVYLFPSIHLCTHSPVFLCVCVSINLPVNQSVCLLYLKVPHAYRSLLSDDFLDNEQTVKQPMNYYRLNECGITNMNPSFSSSVFPSTPLSLPPLPVSLSLPIPPIHQSNQTCLYGCLCIYLLYISINPFHPSVIHLSKVSIASIHLR